MTEHQVDIAAARALAYQLDTEGTWTPERQDKAAATIRTLCDEVEAQTGELDLLRKYLDLETKYHLHSNPAIRDRYFHQAHAVMEAYGAYRARQSRADAV